MQIPAAEDYKRALSSLKISEKQMRMLKAHYSALNRTITARGLAAAAGEKSFTTANLMYGTLGARLGRKLGFPFIDVAGKRTRKFYSSAIGMGVSAEFAMSNEFELMMHHELAKALADLGWFSK